MSEEKLDEISLRTEIIHRKLEDLESRFGGLMKKLEDLTEKCENNPQEKTKLLFLDH
jgi:predicted transcriptional regulator